MRSLPQQLLVLENNHAWAASSNPGRLRYGTADGY